MGVHPLWFTAATKSQPMSEDIQTQTSLNLQFATRPEQKLARQEQKKLKCLFVCGLLP